MLNLSLIGRRLANYSFPGIYHAKLILDRKEVSQLDRRKPVFLLNSFCNWRTFALHKNRIDMKKKQFFHDLVLICYLSQKETV